MTLEYLRYFVAACDCGSIQSASKQLFISAQGIGKGIQRLESSLGVKLLERTQTGVVPTEVGKLYYQQALVVEREIKKLDAIAEEHRNQEKQRLRIGMLGRQKFFYGVDICRRAYMKEHPNANIELSSEIFSSSTELLDAVREGKVDVGWMFHWREHPDLKYLYVSDYSPLLLLISADHPLSMKESVSWDELSSLRYVTAGETDPFSSMMKAVSIDHGFTPDVALYTTENNLIANMVDSNAAAILLRRDYYKAVMKFCSNARAVPVEPEFNVANSLFIKKNSGMSREIRDYVDYMISYFRDTMGIGVKYE